MAKEDQEQRFRAFVQGENFAQYVPSIRAGKPIIVRPHELNEVWQLTSAELQSIVREYHPDLSATASGSACVIFYEKKGQTDASAN